MQSPTGAPMYNSFKAQGNGGPNKANMSPPMPTSSMPTSSMPTQSMLTQSMINSQGAPSPVANPNALMLSAVSKGIGGGTGSQGNSGTSYFGGTSPNNFSSWTKPSEPSPNTSLASLSRFASPITGAIPNGNL